MKKPFVRWTIGSARPAGFVCLAYSIASFRHFYDAEIVVCHNCPPEQIAWLPNDIARYDQRPHLDDPLRPMGVAWKLYPPRLAPDRHEVFIDNDIVFLEHIPEIDRFFQNDATLLLEGNARAYGRYERHIPPGYLINSGIFGYPPGFNMDKYLRFYVGKSWEENATGINEASKTFDEQGLVAIALLDYHTHIAITNETVVDCGHTLSLGKGLHFTALNRKQFHLPFYQFRNRLVRWHL